MAAPCPQDALGGYSWKTGVTLTPTVTGGGGGGVRGGAHTCDGILARYYIPVLWLKPLSIYIVAQLSILGVQPGLGEGKEFGKGSMRQLGPLNSYPESSGRTHPIVPSANSFSPVVFYFSVQGTESRVLCSAIDLLSQPPSLSLLLEQNTHTIH
jgi:hypothetical protein